MVATTALRSRLRDVTVYRRGARITRVVELSRGDSGYASEIVLDGLPLSLDDGSVRARLEAVDGEGALPVASELRVQLAVPEPNEALEPAEDEALEAAKREEASLIAVVAQLEREIAELAALSLEARADRGKKEPPAASPTGGRFALLALRDARRRELREERRKVRIELRRVRRRRAELEDARRRASSARQAGEHELRKALVVRLQSTGLAPAKLRLCVDYMVPGAAWAPAYTLRLDREMRKLSLAMRALVAQKSGEDWSDVRITLSTAEPERWSELVELASMRIGREVEAEPRRGFRPAPAGAEELFADYDRVRRATEEREEEAIAGAVVAAMEEAEDMPTQVLERAAPARTPMPMPASMVMPVPGAPPPPQAALAAPMVARSAGPFSMPFGGARPSLALEDTMEEQLMSGLAAPALLDPVLDYGKLRLASPRADDRGQLVLVDERTLYLELVVHERRRLTLAMMGELDEARAGAEVDPGGLPPGCALAWSEAYDHAYAAEASVDVPADGAFHSIPVAIADGSAAMRYVTVPRESTDVFRMARIGNPFSAPLLPGPVDVYVAGDFLITGRVAFTAPDGELSLGLGVEQGIKVARNTRYREESAGLMGGSLVLEHAIDIELANRTGRKVEVEVRERIPVLVEGEDDIKLEVRDVRPRWEPFEPFPSDAGAERLRGGYRWHIELDRGDDRTLHAGYALRIASKHELVGGNRRE